MLIGPKKPIHGKFHPSAKAQGEKAEKVSLGRFLYWKFSFIFQTLYCPKSLKRTLTAEELGKLNATIECESPHADLYKFHGRLEFGTKTSALLRQSMITRQQSFKSLHSLDENRRTTIPEENELSNIIMNGSFNNNCCKEDCSDCTKRKENAQDDENSGKCLKWRLG